MKQHEHTEEQAARLAALRAPGAWKVPDLPPEGRSEPAPPLPRCRCGAERLSHHRHFPPRDLRDDTALIVTTITERDAQHRSCFTCDHGVGVGGIRTSYRTSAAHDYYHPECVVTDPARLMPGDVVVVTYSRNDGTVTVGHALVLDTHYPTGARPQARLRAPEDLADAHRDPAMPDTYRLYADTVGRVTDPAIVAKVKEAQPA